MTDLRDAYAWCHESDENCVSIGRVTSPAESRLFSPSLALLCFSPCGEVQLSKDLWGVCYVPGTRLGARVIARNRTWSLLSEST